MDFGEQIENLSSLTSQAEEGMQVEDMIELVNNMNDLGVLNEDTITSFYDSYHSEIENLPVQEVSPENYDRLVGMIEDLPASEQIKEVLKSKLSQS